jgi:hypothetical protein
MLSSEKQVLPHPEGRGALPADPPVGSGLEDLTSEAVCVRRSSGCGRSRRRNQRAAHLILFPLRRRSNHRRRVHPLVSRPSRTGRLKKIPRPILCVSSSSRTEPQTLATRGEREARPFEATPRGSIPILSMPFVARLIRSLQKKFLRSSIARQRTKIRKQAKSVVAGPMRSPPVTQRA